MNCYICDKNNWHERQDLNKDGLLKICKTCGNVAYHIEPGAEEKIKQYYRKDYRPAPTYQNLLTSNHKQAYVQKQLYSFLKDKKGLVCGDVGSAIGYIPNFLRRLGHKATGCELTTTYRRFSEHFYSIPLTEELNPKYKYDLITMYHVLEHLIEPDKKLKHLVSLLKDDGHMFISTPEWFDTLEEASGSEIKTFEHWFHKDHINVFSKTSIKNLFKKCGLEIVWEDHITYGQTYLLKKISADVFSEMTFQNEMVVENWEEQNEKLNKIHKAISCLRGAYNQFGKVVEQSKLAEALGYWEKFPDVWLKNIFDIHLKTPEKQEEEFQKAFKIMPENCRLKLAYGVWLYQQQRFEEAIKTFMWILEHRPNEDVMMYLAWCFGHLQQPRESARWAFKSAEMNPLKWVEAMNWICNELVKLPTWDEAALAEIKENFIEKTAPKIEPSDPFMDEVPK